MATRWAVATGLWSNPATWDGGTLPGLSDDVYADGWLVTVDVDVACLSIRTEQRAGGTAGGDFRPSDGVTITAIDVLAGTTSCVQHGSGSAAIVAVNIVGGSGSAINGVRMTSAGTLTIVGNITGGSGANAHGVLNNGAGTLTIVGNPTGGIGGGAIGARNASTGTIMVSGSATGGIGVNAGGTMNNGAGTLTVSGNSTGGSAQGTVGAWNANIGTILVSGDATAGSGAAAQGALNASTGTMTVAGRAIGNNYGSPDNLVAPTVGAHNAGLGLLTVGGIEFGSHGMSPVSGRVFVTNAAPSSAAVDESGTRTDLADYPSPADVRLATEYAFGEQSGTCAVPLPAQTLVGVPVDATIGLLVPDLTELDAIVTTLEARLAVLDPILPDVPAIVIPAPSGPTSTVAWCHCYDQHGAVEEGVVISIQMLGGGSDGSAHDSALATGTSDANGLATVEIPRGAALRFHARRGRGRWIAFGGADADELALPAVLGVN